MKPNGFCLQCILQYLECKSKLNEKNYAKYVYTVVAQCHVSIRLYINDVSSQFYLHRDHMLNEKP